MGLLLSNDSMKQSAGSLVQGVNTAVDRVSANVLPDSTPLQVQGQYISVTVTKVSSEGIKNSNSTNFNVPAVGNSNSMTNVDISL